MSDKEICKEFEKEVVKCSRCGACRTICPIVIAENSENRSARSKVRMMEAVIDGELEMTQGMQDRFDRCLLCKACKTNCGSGVLTDEIIMGGRSKLVKRNGLNFVKQMAFTGLRYRKLFDLALRMGGFFQGLVFKDAPNGPGKIARIPIPAAGLNLRRMIPNMTSNPLRSKLPSNIKSQKPASKGKVLFFTGCTLNYMYPDAGEAVVRVLTRNGYDVVIPEEQCCCGTPAFTSGDFETGKALAEQNLKAIGKEKVDFIITACSSCGAALKHEYGHLLKESPYMDEWRNNSTKVKDISEFVLENCDMSTFGNLPLKITYHDACHLVRGMNVAAQPRAVFKQIPGLTFTEMKDPDRCCGAGGTFSAVYYDLSRKINEVKLDNAEATGMECLVVGCSACRMHMDDGLSQRNSSMKVLHTAELIDQAYAAGEKEGKK